MPTNTQKKETSSVSTTNSAPVKKSQKVKILVSVYRVNDKIISALGIPAAKSTVVHRFPKDKMKMEDLFVFTTHIKNHPPYNKIESYKAVVEQALNNNIEMITLPETQANKLENIGIFTHEILNIEIELLS